MADGLTHVHAYPTKITLVRCVYIFILQNIAFQSPLPMSFLLLTAHFDSEENRENLPNQFLDFIFRRISHAMDLYILPNSVKFLRNLRRQPEQTFTYNIPQNFLHFATKIQRKFQKLFSREKKCLRLACIVYSNTAQQPGLI